MNITFELLNGIVLGIEHISFDEEDQEEYDMPRWMVAVHFFIFRIGFMKY